ncbi:Acyl-CoA N-acyltransferase,GNAT domain [Cinara cedri]|uniref:Glucosamine 6-phosphate N-acetyltransferase n=1 Tax=Cinara cedri TaxID=506608 RepID=A0A5E4NMA8_9HEMI|nr:Acyl-CoA N-acyltransferase,GNAT domain [Cinara cedri]
MAEMALENSIFDPELLKNSYTDELIMGMKDFYKFKLRPLCATDMNKRYVELLSQLTSTGHITEQMFLNKFYEMKNNVGTYYITVIEDTQINVIVASGSLVLEKKFIHSCGQRGRIEDVIVDDLYRGKGFGKLIVQNLIALSRILNCYKISLECKDTNVNWYSSMGFITEHGNSNFMQMRHDE